MKISDAQKKSLPFRLFLAVIGIIGVIGVVALIWFLNLLNTINAERETNCATYLFKPISAEITANLCKQGVIPGSIADCSLASVELHNNDVETILRTNINIGSSTYEEVTEKFGQYTTYCSDANARQNNAQFSCKYDISGVGPKVDVFYDSNTEVAVSVKAPSCSEAN